jgi:predicted 3-demethylubiquinone-9 3-methyltransferase (glyoxalase superfamily)
MPKITPFLWFDTQAEEAMNFYASIFKNSKVHSVSKMQGKVLSVQFELDGQHFMALNAGPVFKFNEAVSFQIYCKTQEDIDYYWEKLSQGGDPKAQQCGWLKDKYGLSWQVVPAALPEIFKDHESPQAQRVMEAMLRMKKLDIRELERAAAGETVMK